MASLIAQGHGPPSSMLFKMLVNLSMMASGRFLSSATLHPSLEADNFSFILFIVLVSCSVVRGFSICGCGDI